MLKVLHKHHKNPKAQGAAPGIFLHLGDLFSTNRFDKSSFYAILIDVFRDKSGS